MKNSYGTLNSFGLLIGRCLMAALFIPAGIAKATHFAGTVGMMQAMHTPAPEVGAAVAVICELPVAFLLVLGLQTRLMCLVLILYTAGATYLAHRFWLMPPAQVMEAQINFFKNVAVIGGFIILAAAGPGRFSVDKG